MNNSLLIEVFARVSFSFTQGVTEHYDPDDPEVEIFGYNDSLSSEGREWNCQPVDKPIYQEYSPPSDDNYDLLSVDNSRVRFWVINASSPDEDEDEQQNEDVQMAWKRFRPSVLRTVCQSMYIGALISLLTPAFIGLLYVIISYVPYDTCGFFVGMLFLFRPYQLKGVKRKLILVAFVLSCLDTVYRVVLQVFGISISQLSVFQKISLNILASLSSNKSLLETVE